MSEYLAGLAVRSDPFVISRHYGDKDIGEIIRPRMNGITSGVVNKLASTLRRHDDCHLEQSR